MGAPEVVGIWALAAMGACPHPEEGGMPNVAATAMGGADTPPAGMVGARPDMGACNTAEETCGWP